VLMTEGGFRGGGGVERFLVDMLVRLKMCLGGGFGLVDSWFLGSVKNDEEMVIMIDDWRGLLD